MITEVYMEIEFWKKKKTQKVSIILDCAKRYFVLLNVHAH